MRCLATGRHKKTHELLQTRARHPKLNRCRTFVHALPTRDTDLRVKFHAEHAPALPVIKMGKTGKVKFCPQQVHPAASKAILHCRCQAALKRRSTWSNCLVSALLGGTSTAMSRNSRFVSPCSAALPPPGFPPRRSWDRFVRQTGQRDRHTFAQDSQPFGVFKTLMVSYSG